MILYMIGYEEGRGEEREEKIKGREMKKRREREEK
jgi:hypothetical protein